MSDLSSQQRKVQAAHIEHQRAQAAQMASRRAKVTAGTRQRLERAVAVAREALRVCEQELTAAERAERVEMERKRAERDAEIRQHLAEVYERQRQIMATSGKLAVFVGTKPEDWIEWNGELVIAPRDIAEATGLDVRVATRNVAEWKDEPSFTGNWGVPTRDVMEMSARKPGQGVLWQLDFDQIWEEDWG